jgi:hypothetical protein
LAKRFASLINSFEKSFTDIFFITFRALPTEVPGFCYVPSIANNGTVSFFCSVSRLWVRNPFSYLFSCVRDVSIVSPEIDGISSESVFVFKFSVVCFNFSNRCFDIRSVSLALKRVEESVALNFPSAFDS